jgi:hypothetical protein
MVDPWFFSTIKNTSLFQLHRFRASLRFSPVGSGSPDTPVSGGKNFASSQA